MNESMTQNGMHVVPVDSKHGCKWESSKCTYI